MLSKIKSLQKKYVDLISTFFLIKTSKSQERYRNAILFSSHNQKYTDNSKYLYEYLNSKGYKAYYITRHPKNSDDIRYKSKDYYASLKTCSAVCFTHTEEDIAPYIPKSAVRINLWHGSPIKKMGFDSPVDMKRLKKYSYLPIKHPYRRWDYVIIQNELFKQPFVSALKCDESKLINLGLPRNDHLTTTTDVQKKSIMKSMGINDDLKNILYAPTFRENDFDIIATCENLKSLILEKFSDCRLIIRLHPFDQSKISASFFEERIFDAGALEDPQDLLVIADTLITDYSSISFDYASLDRKIILFCPDHSQYSTTRGGFYFNLMELPFLYCQTTEELERALQENSQQLYSDQFPPSEAKRKLENFLLEKKLLSTR